MVSVAHSGTRAIIEYAWFDVGDGIVTAEAATNIGTSGAAGTVN